MLWLSKPKGFVEPICMWQFPILKTLDLCVLHFFGKPIIRKTPDRLHRVLDHIEYDVLINLSISTDPVSSCVLTLYMYHSYFLLQLQKKSFHGHQNPVWRSQTWQMSSAIKVSRLIPPGVNHFIYMQSWDLCFHPHQDYQTVISRKSDTFEINSSIHNV